MWQKRRNEYKNEKKLRKKVKATYVCVLAPRTILSVTTVNAAIGLTDHNAHVADVKDSCGWQLK